MPFDLPIKSFSRTLALAALGSISIARRTKFRFRSKNPVVFKTDMTLRQS